MCECVCESVCVRVCVCDIVSLCVFEFACVVVYVSMAHKAPFSAGQSPARRVRATVCVLWSWWCLSLPGTAAGRPASPSPS